MQLIALKTTKGFSLIEAITFLAILGIMTAITVPLLANQNEAFRDARDRRNAQEILSVCTTAKAAGLDFVAGTDLTATIRNAIRGGSPASGALKGKVFKVCLIDDETAVSAARFLAIVNGELIYCSRDA